MSSQPAHGANGAPTRERDPDSSTDATAVAIIAAAREEFVRYGVQRANVEQIARRAKVARITVYRRFSNKAALLRAVILADIADFAARFDDVWYRADTPQEKIVEAIVLSVEEIRHQPLLVSLMRSEPDQLLPQLTLDGQEPFELYRTLLVARIDELVERGELAPLDTAKAAEVTLRLGYSILLLPYGLVPGQSDEDVREFARDYIVPLFL